MPGRGVEGSALGRADVRVAVVEEQVDIPDILIPGRDVPVTGQRHLRRRVGFEQPDGVLAQELKPFDLVCHVGVAERAPVRHIEAPHPHATARGADGAGFLDRIRVLAEHGLAGERALNVGQTHARRYGHTVPLAHPEVGHLVAHALEELPGKVLVLAFRFLNGQDVTIRALKPGLHTVGAGAERIHIPGSNLHSP